ncbi:MULTISPECIES: hypothetical protein [Pseudonocardia]|uniref:Uncharacterized protein n=2 Tax=Pseudonocardia TaxID=1847 RepID=A0A1Y2N9U8_PSEAH|nr:MULTISPECIES: hypothetical protein [Pseudonocardia]OSY44232.1 hypothetical protein BG845_00353 [Pseudonocardia autotrophica]TDN74038.1 hypothetical protein C8E95_3153 [Pseudonocardia autotrophica]BBG04795.1 hypothetical protein Pdca_60040 [Pseudonocardia autotrophica]GEC23451.1 hypothetical protein PSA01_04800 [Pseudonocardia saturnea]
MLYPQPTEMTLDEPVEHVDRPCAACGAAELYRYRLADYRGWLRVVKCRSCLITAERERIPAPPQGTS